jgi:hypothetical protein
MRNGIMLFCKNCRTQKKKIKKAIPLSCTKELPAILFSLTQQKLTPSSVFIPEAEHSPSLFGFVEREREREREGKGAEIEAVK